LAEYRWYVAQALPGLEATAIYHLSREGITAYAPVISKDRAARLFPGYVFVELETPDEAGLVNRTRGIHKVLPIHTLAPLALPRGFVEDLRESLARGDFSEKSEDELMRRYAPGDDVMPTNGPFRDLRGRFLRYSKGCGIVLTYLLGKEHELKIPLKSLAPVPNVTSSRMRGASGAKKAA